MFSIHPWPQVILHLDGDAFFASVIQATRPHLRGKPLVTGHERGIATAISYEAKQMGIKRGMRFSEMKKLCPQCIFIESDYELFSLFSCRMFSIMRQFSPVVEEYSIDEGFTDLKGLRRPLHMGYSDIGKKIKDTIESNLGISVSVGISLTKSLAKIASNFHKPSGLTIIKGNEIESFLSLTPVEKIWGIGAQTSAYLKKWGINTALQFVSQSESFIAKHLSKPYREIWNELKGKQIYQIHPEAKTTYSSISKTRTFYPATGDKNVLFARLTNHIEEAFSKARRYHYAVGKLFIFLKTQDFRFHTIEIRIASPVCYPSLIRDDIRRGFAMIYKVDVLYRTTGCTVTQLTPNNTLQQSLFQNIGQEEKMSRIYPLLEEKKIDFGTKLYDNGGKLPPSDRKKPDLPFLNLSGLVM